MRRSPLGKLFLLLSAGVAALASHASAQDIQVVTYTNTTWIYNDSSTAANNPGTAWKEPGFVPVIGTGENEWKANGKGLFGNDTSAVYNEPNDPFRGGTLGFATPLDRGLVGGTGTRITFYFVTKFNWPYDPAGVILRGTNYLDDGAIVYLNGVEVFRSRVPGTVGVPPDWTQLGDNQGAEGVPEPLEYSATSLVTGENVLAVELHQSSAGSSDVAFATALRAVIPFAPVISTPNEPADRSVVQNRSTTLSVTGDGSPKPTFQWFKDGVAIDGATTASYTITNMQSDTAGLYKVILNNEFGSATSREANVTFVADEAPPVVVSVSANGSFTNVIIKLDEAITPGSATDPFGYEIASGPNLPGVISQVLLADGMTVVLGLDAALVEDTIYTIAVKSPTDLVGLTIAENTIVSFRTWKLAPGFITFEAYGTGGGNSVSELIAHPSFPYSPRETFYLTSFDTRKVYPDDSHEGYGGRLSGVFIPPTSGNWIFYLNADDGSELYLNPFGPAADGKTLIQSRADCCATFAANASVPQALTAGQSYYIEALYKEGGGGDYCRVAAKLDSDPTDPSLLSPIPAAWLGTFVYPVGIGINITQNPANQIASISTGAQTVGLEDFNTSGAKFTVTTPGAFQGTPWAYNAGAGSWQVNQVDTENGVANTTYLLSPTLSVVQSGVLSVSFAHRWSLESSGGNWDGCALQISVNGGAFTTVPNSAFSAGGYSGTVVAGNSILTGQEAWVADSPDHQVPSYVTSVASLGTLNAGDNVQLRFLYAGDTNTKGPFQPSWEINSVEFSPALESNYADAAVTFTALAEATLNSAPTPVAYQWQRNNGDGFFDIIGATASTYSFLPTARDNGAIFRSIVSSPGAGATSTEATLTVAPKQFITVTGDSAVISWPAPSTGFVLEQASALLTPAATVWSPVGIAPTVSGGMNTVTVTGAGAGQKFYRLKK